ncbi:MAG: chemotaxis protein CheA [Actinobacteria bacterium]|nr:chemotaxis protein CheA [Actinomycetota bacterium]
MPRKKKNPESSHADVVNALATAVADIEEGPPDRLLDLALLVLDATVKAPPGLVAHLMDIAHATIPLRTGEKPFDEAYEALSAAVDEAARAVESGHSDEASMDTSLPSGLDELSMDLAVLRGFVEETEGSFADAAPFMGPIIDRLLASELPSSMESTLRYVHGLRMASGLEGTGEGHFDFAREALAALGVAESLLSNIRDEADSGRGDAQAPSTPLSFDSDRVEAFLQRLDECESRLLAMGGGGPEDEEAPREFASLLEDMTREQEALALTSCGERLRELSTAMESCASGLPDEAIGVLLEIKDLLEAHFCFLVEEERAGDMSAIADKALSAAESLRSAAAIRKAGKRRVKPSSVKAEQGMERYLELKADRDEVQDFLAEAPEYVQMIESALLELERDPSDAERLNEAFRGFHNLKGSAGFLKLDKVVDVSHAAESLLAEAREGRLLLSGTLADLSFEALDALKRLLEGVEIASTGALWVLPEGLDDLVDRLRRATSGETLEQTPPRKRKTKPRGKAKSVHPSPAMDAPSAGVTSKPEEEGPPAASIQAESQPSRDSSAVSRKEDSLVRVSTSRLDALIDAVGELVIAHSMVAQEKEVAETRNPRLARNLSQLTKITRELQELAMGMRMVSLKNTFQKMARLARDLSAKSGTPLDFTYSGEDTEIDRNLVEEINSPLVHMVRNAVDHGIESPEERKRAGKPERGRVELRGYHEGGNVVIELSDDGRGLDAGSILEKALKLGVVSKEDASRLGEEEVYRLIFHEGLSTARKVTDISGRGVGMDVVKKTIEGLRGRVDISSQPGRGTTFTIRLPLTLAIIDGMVVLVADEEYVVPSISIHSSFRPRREQVSTVTGKGEVISLRGEIIPLFRLHRLFGLEGAKSEPWEALALILGSNGDRCAVMVDDIAGQQQVVIKSLGEMFSRLPGVSGGAIMGSGKVALILDPPGLINLAHGRGVT